MDANTPHDDQTLFHANIAALERVNAACAAALRNAQPPFDVERTIARDGELTFAWREGSGKRTWLGRTAIPTIRATALVDAFNPGSQNTLMVGFGQSVEAERLLTRLLPHQALFIVDESPWSVALALQLRDFSIAIDTGQLRLFVGENAWDGFHRFLETDNGYLVPDRMLAWPWFEPRDVAMLTQRLTDINKLIAQHRAETLASIRATPLTGDRTDAIVVWSNIAQPRIHRVSQMIAAAAHEAGRPCETFALDTPSRVHPVAYEQALQELKPALIVSIESLPETMSNPCNAPMLVLLTGQEQRVQPDKVALLPPQSYLGVCNQSQRDDAATAGMPVDHILLVPPAASPGIRIGESSRSEVAIVGDIVDCSPSAAGLNLATHQRMYNKAGELIRDAIAAGTPYDSEAVLTDAEKKLKIRLESRQVRAGIVERIRKRLIPSLTRIACCDALRDAGIEFGIFGNGWSEQKEWRGRSRGAWPAPPDLPQTLAACGMLIVPDIDESASQAMLDAAAAGTVIAIRCRGTECPLGNATDTDHPESALRFDSPKELAEIIRRFQSAPDEYVVSARQTAADVAANHTWTQRLAALMSEIESRTR